jgi:hypothetical protein
MTDKEAKTTFAVGDFINQLLEMHNIEQMVIDATPLDRSKGLDLAFDAPLNRYVITVNNQSIILQRIIVVVWAQKTGTQVPLQQGAIGATRFAYGKGTSFDRSYILSLAERVDDDVRATLQLHDAHGRKQNITLAPSEALAKKMRDLRENK